MEDSFFFFYCFSGDETRYNMLAEPFWIQAVFAKWSNNSWGSLANFPASCQTYMC